MTQVELTRRINQEEELIGWKTRTKPQHINNMLKNNYISKLRAMKIERALGLEDGYLSDLVTSTNQGIELYKTLQKESKLCKNIKE